MAKSAKKAVSKSAKKTAAKKPATKKVKKLELAADYVGGFKNPPVSHMASSGSLTLNGWVRGPSGSPPDLFVRHFMPDDTHDDHEVSGWKFDLTVDDVDSLGEHHFVIYLDSSGQPVGGTAIDVV